MASALYPSARREGFVVQPLDGELILHDGTVTHLLNATAASVWQLCDGHHSIADMARELALDQETVMYTLQQLERKLLLEKNSATMFAFKSMTRREFLKKGALAAAVIPVVKTIQLPSPQAAASGCLTEDCVGECLQGSCTENCDCNLFGQCTGFCDKGCCFYD